MNATDSAYIWGINPQNAGNLSQQQVAGLSSLAPGFGLTPDPQRTRLDPYSNLPTPQFSKDAADKYFGFVPKAAGVNINTRTAAGQMKAPAANVDASADLSTAKPYFDPNYPYESMLALKNWLAPRVAQGASQAMHSRGLDYTGTGGAVQQNAMGYLDQLAPAGENGQQAMENDFSYLYGPNIGGSLATGGSVPGQYLGYNTHGQPTFGNAAVAPSIPGASASVPGGNNAGAYLVGNPGYQPGAATPQFGLYSLASQNSYAGPGYFYDPSQAPDVNKMPWLAAPPQPDQSHLSPNV